MAKSRPQSPAPGADAAPSAAPDNTVEVLQLGVQHHRAGRLEQAVALYRLVLSTEPKNPDALQLLGLATLHGGDPVGALPLIERAILARPGVGGWHTTRGQALVALKRRPEALAAFREAITLNPTDVAAQDGAAKLLRQAGRLQEAATLLEAALTYVQDAPALHLSLGNTYQALDRMRDAEACFRRALALDDSSGPTRANLALALFLLGERDEAIARYREALTLSPDVATIHLGLGWALFGAADLAEAKACFEHALALDPDLAEGHVKMGLVALAEGDLDAARSNLARATALFREPARSTAPFKLRHDREQLNYLKRNRIVMAQRAAAGDARLARAMSALPAELRDDSAVPLTPAQLTQLGLDNAMPYHLPDCPALPGGALSPDLDPAAIEAAYFAARPQLTMIDGLLSAPALDALRRFCWSATIWHDIKPGYLGAYLKEGFACDLMLQIAHELRAALPTVLGDHPLIEMWAYKYDQTLGGIETHADCAAVNLNFWIAPDEANEDPDSGGLEVFTREAPLDWDFHRYNRDQAAIAAFLDAEGRDAVTVPHRANRALLFNSNLLHRTDRFQFRPGYENRRINITLLFGHRAARQA